MTAANRYTVVTVKLSALWLGQLIKVKEILDQHIVDVDNCTNAKQETPLHLACEQNNDEMVQLLIAYGADPNRKDSKGMEPSQKGKAFLVKIINKTLFHNDWIKSPTSDDGDSPLHIAVRQGKLEAVKNFLEQNDVDVSCLNSNYETPLHLACVCTWVH